VGPAVRFVPRRISIDIDDLVTDEVGGGEDRVDELDCPVDEPVDVA
jgi:hypothetical protein